MDDFTPRPPPTIEDYLGVIYTLERDGEPAWWEFEVLRVFGGEQEARAYAAEHGISAGK